MLQSDWLTHSYTISRYSAPLNCHLSKPITWYHLARSGTMYGLLTKCEVNMAGYWPSSFFACLWTETKSRSINSQKKERGQYAAILAEQSWSIKDLLYGFRGIFHARYSG